MSTEQYDEIGSWVYSLYGLRLRSNLKISSLMLATQSGDIDIDITFTEVENHPSQAVEVENVFASPGFAENGLPYFKVWRNTQDSESSLGLEYTNGTGFATFLVNQLGNKIRATRAPSILIQDMVTYFLGPVMGCVLSLRQVTCLHAGVVVVDGKALAIIGPKGAGKSTTTASLAHFGKAVLSDDIAPLNAVDGQYMVSPGYLSLRLWPNTIDALPGVTTENLRKVLSLLEKRFINLSSDADAKRWKFHPHPTKLAAVYALNNRNETDTLSINALPQAAGLLKLAGNVYPEYSLSQTDRKRDFLVLGKLAASVPVREVNIPDDMDSLTQLRDAILTDFKTLV